MSPVAWSGHHVGTAEDGESVPREETAMGSVPVRQLGGPMARRQLHYIWILDCSGSMNAAGKLQALNTALAEALPLLRAAAEENVTADVLVRVAAFSDGARWHVAGPTPVEEFRLPPITAGGLTDLGAALELVATALESPPIPERALAPVLTLVSDGQPTDDFRAGLRALLASRWGARSVRLAIAIGQDADREVLQEFIGHGKGIAPVQANSPEAVVDAIRWATTAVKSPVTDLQPVPPSEDDPDVFAVSEDWHASS
jgi:uncharacterized protein YegL